MNFLKFQFRRKNLEDFQVVVFLLYTSAPHRPITASAAARQNEKKFRRSSSATTPYLQPDFLTTSFTMRAKRSKKYRKLMHQYELTFNFREPYQVLGMLPESYGNDPF